MRDIQRRTLYGVQPPVDSPPGDMDWPDVHAPNADLIATDPPRNDEMKAPALCIDPPTIARRLSRRRLVVLLAAASAVATLAACGEPEKRKPGGYDFPGAQKDGAGRFKSSQTLQRLPQAMGSW